MANSNQKPNKSNTDGVDNKKPNNNAKGGKSKSRREGVKHSASAKWSETQAINDALNDPEWYASLPDLLYSSASVNFFNPLGGPTNLERYYNSTPLDGIPGLCVLDYVPVLGVSDSNTSPVNMAARNLYTFVHSVMAVGSSSYEPADLMLYAMSMASAYSYCAWMRRLYGCINLYSQLNKYMPDSLLEGMHVKPSAMRDKMMSLYNYISLYQNKLGSFAIPTSLTYFTREMWMCSGLYLDAPTNKAQMYMFNPDCFWRYEEYEGAGKLVRVDLPGNMTMDDIVTFGDQLLGSLVASQDVYTMSGDVLHAFGDNGIFKMDVLDPSYTLMAFYVPEVLTQIHNATVMGGISPRFTEITQDTSTGLNGGSIICKPEVVGAAYGGHIFNKPRLLSMPMDMPTPADTMVATRLMAFAKYDEENGSTVVTSCGTEIITRCTIFKGTRDPSTDEWHIDSVGGPGYAPIVTTVSPDAVMYSTWISYLNMICMFSYHPFIGMWRYYTNDDSVTLLAYDFDVDNYTTVDETMIDRMHACALMSMYKVPVMGLFDKKS